MTAKTRTLFLSVDVNGDEHAPGLMAKICGASESILGVAGLEDPAPALQRMTQERNELMAAWQDAKQKNDSIGLRMLEAFESTGCANYFILDVFRGDEKFALTIQRVEGKSPGQVNAEQASELDALREEVEIHRAANRPCVCPDVSNTPHVAGCPHPLRVLKERDSLTVLVADLREQIKQLEFDICEECGHDKQWRAGGSCAWCGAEPIPHKQGSA